MQKTCCQIVEILVTPGDIARIAAHTERADFWERRRPDDPRFHVYCEDDPNWVRYTIAPDGARRQLKQRANGDCTFLGPSGCSLPGEVRPLICRMYPYDYNERGITGEVSVYCPTEVLAPPGSGLTMLTVLGMSQDDGERWRSMLYQELREALPSMRIGLTYDLKDDYVAAGLAEEAAAEFDSPETIDAIEHTLRELGHQTHRIGSIRSLTSRLASGERWDVVWNIAEGLHGIGREAQVPALLDAYQIPYTFSDPLVLGLTLHKAMTKRIVRDLGIPTPDFALVEREPDIDRVNLEFPLFVKPVAEGSSKGVSANSLVRDRAELTLECRNLLARFPLGVLVERYLPGREFTVGIIGTGDDARVIGAMEVVLLDRTESGVYSYNNKELYEDRVRYEAVTGAALEEARALALAAWRGLGCRDAGRVDLRADAAGRLSFIEVNPLPGLHPRRSDLTILCGLAGTPFKELIARILRSAGERIVPFTPLADTPPEDAAQDGPDRPPLGARVLMLHDAVPEGALADESEVTVQVDAVCEGLIALGHSVETAACGLDLAALTRLVSEHRPDLVFNLVESLECHGRLCHVVPSVLDTLGVSYSGSAADVLFATTNKLIAKRLLRSGGLRTPDWRTLEELRVGADIAPARYILKSVWEHASRGLGRASVVEATTAAELADALESRWDSLAGEGFAETYIHGREFRLSMLAGEDGPQVLPTSEIVFEAAGSGVACIDTYAAKWEDPASPDYMSTTRRYDVPASDAAMLEEVQRIGRSVWSLFGLRGYARIDFRVDEAGRAWVIDVNANPSLSPLAGFVAALEQAGIPFSRAIERILNDIPVRVGAAACIQP